MLEAISTSDFHLEGMNKHFKDATRRQLREVDKVYQYAMNKGVKHVFIPGDISDTPKMSPSTYMQLLLFLKKYDGIINTYYIGGNHDRSDSENTSCDLLKLLCEHKFFKTFRIFLEPEQDRIEDVLVNFCAWPCNESLTETEGSVNFAHVATNGSIGDNGRKIKVAEDFSSHKNDYTVSGHIHQYQHIEKQRIVYNGNPYQKNFGEKIPKGFIHFRANTVKDKVKFTHRFVDNMPGFTLQTVTIETAADFKKLRSDDNVRYKLLVAPDILIPTDLRVMYPNITGGIFNAQTNKATESITDIVDMPETASIKIQPTHGLKDYLKAQGFSKKDMVLAKGLVKEAMQELNLS